MRGIFFGLVALLMISIAPAQLPEFYRSVDRMTWVVEDLDKTIEGWGKLGFTDVIRHGEVDLPGVQFRGEPATVRVRAATALFGDVLVDWVQPLGGKNAYAEFQAAHGSGVFSLLHQVPSGEALAGELRRLNALGVGVLQEGSLELDGRRIRYVYFDTEPEGKYILGLFSVPGSLDSTPLALPASVTAKRRITQYAFVVQDLDSVSRFWAKIGFPEMEVTHPYLWDLRYHDQPGEFDAKLGWHRHGKVTYEWILPLKGPTVYSDHVEKRGQGIHHLAFAVEDFQQAVAEWNELGFPFIQGGAWGEKDKPGHGRFAYHETDPIGGIDIELLWNYR